jgi:hypothetical protein
MIVLLLFICIFSEYLTYLYFHIDKVHMELDIRIKMNEKLFLRNPEESVFGEERW